MPKAQNDLNDDLMWSMLKLGKSDALVSGFKPISESILQNSQLTGAYYFYNETYDRLVIISPPPKVLGVHHGLDALQLNALRAALKKPSSKVVELAIRDNYLDGPYTFGNIYVTTLYEVYPNEIADEDRDDESREEDPLNDRRRNCRTLILDRTSEIGVVSLVQKLQYLCDIRDSSQRLDKILQKDIDALYTHIDDFRVYAEGLAQDTSPDNLLTSLAVSLKRDAENFFQNNTAITSTECADFKRNFMKKLHAQDSIINTTGKQIVANILIALTGIGALLLLIQLTHSAYKTGSCCSFFFSGQVKTQSKIDVIDNAVTQLTEPLLPGPTII